MVPVKGADRYLYRGAILPEGVDKDDIKRLKSIGLVKDVKVQTRPRAAASTSQPDGDGENTAEDGASTESEDSNEEQTDSEANDASADDAPKTRSRAKK